MGSSKTPKWHFLAKVGRIFLALFKPRAEKTTFLHEFLIQNLKNTKNDIPGKICVGI